MAAQDVLALIVAGYRCFEWHVCRIYLTKTVPIVMMKVYPSPFIILIHLSIAPWRTPRVAAPRVGSSSYRSRGKIGLEVLALILVIRGIYKGIYENVRFVF